MNVLVQEPGGGGIRSPQQQHTQTLQLGHFHCLYFLTQLQYAHAAITQSQYGAFSVNATR